MAARSFFLTLARTCRAQTTPFRSLSTSTASTSQVLVEESDAAASREEEEEEQPEYEIGGVDDLKSRIFRLRLPKRSVSNTLQKWVSDGNKITAADLRSISRDLRKSRRYKHALEISEWMIAHEESELRDSDYAVRIDLMTKVFGIDAAERYFDGLPPAAKTSETYTAMLHSYAGAKHVDKAEQLYARAKKENLSLSALTYNEMMTLYMSVGQMEKVPEVIQELKRNNITPDLFTYNLLVSSYAATMDIKGARRVLDEMRSNEDWEIYAKLANIYITAGNLVNSESNSLVDSEKGISQREWVTYDFLIILYTGLGNKDRVEQIWKSLRMTKQKMISRNYLCVVSSYLMLGELKEVEQVVDQWKQSAGSDFDVSACHRVIEAFTDSGLPEKADSFKLLLAEKGWSENI